MTAPADPTPPPRRRPSPVLLAAIVIIAVACVILVLTALRPRQTPSPADAAASAPPPADAAVSQRAVDCTLELADLHWETWTMNGNLDDMTDEDIALFTAARDDQAIANAIRALVAKRAPVTVVAYAASPWVDSAPLLKKLGKPDDISGGNVLPSADDDPFRQVMGAWYHYGGVAIGVDQQMQIRSMRAEIYRWK